MLIKNDIDVDPLELGETHFSSGKFHLMDIIFRRWSNLLQNTFYSKMDLMVEVTTENVEKMTFENFFSMISKQLFK